MKRKGLTGPVLKAAVGGAVSLLGVVGGPILLAQRLELLGGCLLLVGVIAGLAITGATERHAVELQS